LSGRFCVSALAESRECAPLYVRHSVSTRVLTEKRPVALYTVYKKLIFREKIAFTVDVAISVHKLSIPPEAGPDISRGGSCLLGTANWNSILSRDNEAVSRPRSNCGGQAVDNLRGNKVGFFCWPKWVRTAGSLTSTYRVVNTTLRAESEILAAAGRKTARLLREFQLSKFDPAFAGSTD